MNTQRVVNILNMLSFISDKPWTCSKAIQEHMQKIGDPVSLRVIQFRLTALAEAGVLQRHPRDVGQNIRYRMAGHFSVIVRSTN